MIQLSGFNSVHRGSTKTEEADKQLFSFANSLLPEAHRFSLDYHFRREVSSSRKHLQVSLHEKFVLHICTNAQDDSVADVHVGDFVTLIDAKSFCS